VKARGGENVKSEQLELEPVLEDESEEVVPFKYSISSYGADYTVDSLVKRLDDDTIFNPPFQRGFVWSLGDASRFIESLLLGLPVPGIFLAKEQESRRLLVVDGQQRLRTLQMFYDGIFVNKKEFALKGVQKQFAGLTYKTLPSSDKRQLDDSIIHATIIKQDEPSEDDSSIYYIFQRLNTTGIELKPQEIRACIYHGEFSDLLGELNKNAAWRRVFGPVHKSMRDQELVLRFLALYFDGHDYAKPLNTFLNKYMGRNRHLNQQSESAIKAAFNPTIEIATEALGDTAFRPRKALNAAVFDSVMVGLATRLSRGRIKSVDEVRTQYKKLLEKDDFRDATEKSTTDEEAVEKRLNIAMQVFASVK
jgi:hypothetical protein